MHNGCGNEKKGVDCWCVICQQWTPFSCDALHTQTLCDNETAFTRSIAICNGVGYGFQGGLKFSMNGQRYIAHSLRAHGIQFPHILAFAGSIPPRSLNKLLWRKRDCSKSPWTWGLCAWHPKGNTRTPFLLCVSPDPHTHRYFEEKQLSGRKPHLGMPPFPRAYCR